MTASRFSERLAALLKGATKGPWRVYPETKLCTSGIDTEYAVAPCIVLIKGKGECDEGDQSQADMELIIFQRNAAEKVLALVEACEKVALHLQELRDAWQRGIIDERDGKGGTRSNRNVECEVALRTAIHELNLIKQ